MKQVKVDLGDRSYPICIGRGLLANRELLTDHIGGSKVFVVTNETVGPLYLGRLRETLSAFDVDSIELPDGERYKTLATMNDIVTALLQRTHNRSTTLVALGGGVVGDLTGFAAASFMRGVNFIQAPTSLLAQVDSSVGGKTGVNHELGKNMIGAFYQPSLVLIDTDTLGTLPAREFAGGMAEVIKHGALWDRAFFEWLEEQLPVVLSTDPDALTFLVERNCRIKADVVGRDEREAGIRSLLNLGHTFGHAIETGEGYGKWIHGEAVGSGLVMAADLSARLGMLAVEDARRIKQLVERAGLPTCPPAMAVERWQELMQVDKKAVAGKVRYVLLDGIGKAVVVDDAPDEMVRQTLTAQLSLCDGG